MALALMRMILTDNMGAGRMKGYLHLKELDSLLDKT